MKQLFTIEPIDFDEAVKQNWSVRTCLIAKAGERQNIPLYVPDGPPRVRNQIFWQKNLKEKCDPLMYIFDNNFQRPGDEKRPALQLLRAKLPVSVEIKI